MTTLRIIGIDLAVTAAHKAIVLDTGSNEFVSHVMSFHATPAEIDEVLAAARRGAPQGTPFIAVLEATHMAWFTVGTYLHRHGVEVYRVNGRQTADQRKVYHRHAKSDRIDARVLPRLYTNAPERVTRLFLPPTPVMELQRLCREVVRLGRLISASKNRLKSMDTFAWLGLKEVFPSFDPATRWAHRYWYDPWRVCQTDPDLIHQAWSAEYPALAPTWLPAFIDQAQQVVAFYGDPAPLDYVRLQAFLNRELDRLEACEAQHHSLRIKHLRPLYRQLDPQRFLETIFGVGQDSAAVYHAFIGDIRRFPSINDFLGWSGMIPFSSQSGSAQSKGLHITQAGPDLIKRTAFINADVARRYDPQIAAIYYDQMVNKGKHHLQAVCACATHLLTRVFVVLRDKRPFELRDIDGTPLSKKQTRSICEQHYTVPDHIRQQNSHRARKQRIEHSVEQRTQRRLAKQRSKG